MGTGANKTKQTKNKVQLPKYLDTAYKGLVKAGAKTAKQPQEVYTGSTQAGFTPMQQAGFNAISNAQGAALPYFNAASGMYGNAANMNWGAVPTNTVDAAGVNNASAGISGGLDWGSIPTDTVDEAGWGAASGAVMPGVDRYDSATLAQYMDPYMTGMIDPIMERMHREDAKQVNNLKGSGIAGGVSPSLGDRMGLAAADLSGQQALARNQTLGQLMSQGFQNAQSQLNAQQQLQLQGGSADRDALMQAQAAMQSGNSDDAARALQGLVSKGTFSQADQQRLMEAQQLMQQGRSEDASRILATLSQQQSGNLAAASGMAGLGTAAQDSIYQGIDYMMNAGGMQQQQGQQGLDAAYQQWMAQQNYPKEQVDWLANLIYGSPGKGAATTTTTEPGPSLLSQIAGLGLGAAGLGKSMGWFGQKHGGRVHHRDAGGPVIDVGRFSAPVGLGGSGYGAIPGGTGVQPGEWYVNALPRMTPEMAGHEPGEKVKLPKYLRHIFKNIARGAGGLGPAAGNDEKDEPNHLWKNFFSGVGGKAKKKAVGGGILEDEELLPGTPEYQAEVDRLLAGGAGGGATPSGGAEPAPVAAAASSAAPPGGMGAGFLRHDPGLAMLYAGLGIMGGDSPFPLENVGKGGLTGLKMAQDLYADELDNPPVVDDSGPTIRYWDPETKTWTDSGIPTANWAAVEVAAGKTPDGTETERYMAEKWGADWRKNPEAQKEFADFRKTPSTRIDMTNETEASKRYWSVTDAAADAVTKAEKYNQIGELLADPTVYAGTGGEFVGTLKKAAKTFLGLDVEGSSNIEVAGKLANEMIGDFKSMLPGPMSNSDVAIIKSIPPTVSDSKEGIQLMVEMQSALSSGLLRNMNKLQEISASEPDGTLTQAGYNKYVNWLAKNPIFPPGTMKRLQDVARAKSPQTSPSAGAEAIIQKYKLEVE